MQICSYTKTLYDKFLNKLTIYVTFGRRQPKWHSNKLLKIRIIEAWMSWMSWMDMSENSKWERIVAGALYTWPLDKSLDWGLFDLFMIYLIINISTSGSLVLFLKQPWY